MMTGTVKDDATASVHEDFDFDNNRYKTEENNTYDPSFSLASTMFSSQTALERLGAMLFNDDKSLDQQFLDDRMNNETTGAPAAAAAKRTRISPFEVRAPPGLLGMVVDSLPNGGPPIVRAIQPNSVLEGKVRIGDRLLSVNNKDVTGLTAKDVSNLISFKQNEERLLKFVRIE
jgi:C-terminal processing protease CtpA/Prc